MSKTYGPKPQSFTLDDGERYYVGADVGQYLKYHRGTLYKRFPQLWKVCDLHFYLKPFLNPFSAHGIHGGEEENPGPGLRRLIHQFEYNVGEGQRGGGDLRWSGGKVPVHRRRVSLLLLSLSARSRFSSQKQRQCFVA